MIESVKDHTERLKEDKVAQSVYNVLADKVQQMEYRNRQLGDKLNAQKSVVNQLENSILANIQNVTDQLANKVSHAEYQSLHQATDMFSNSLKQLDAKHKSMDDSMSSVKNEITELLTKQQDDIAALQKDQSDTKASRLKHISKLSNLLKRQNETINMARNDLENDKLKIETLESFL